MASVTDAFTGTAGTTITAGAWAIQPSFINDIWYSAGGNTCDVGTTDGAGSYYALLYSTTTFTANQTVAADIIPKSSQNSSDIACVCARIVTSNDGGTYYAAWYDKGALQWKLQKSVAGSITTLGTFSQTLTNGTTYNVRLEANGTALKVWIDGTLQISATDSAISAAGRPGILMHGTHSRGYEIDNFAADDVTTASKSASDSGTSTTTASVASDFASKSASDSGTGSEGPGTGIGSVSDDFAAGVAGTDIAGQALLDGATTWVHHGSYVGNQIQYKSGGRIQPGSGGTEILYYTSALAPDDQYAQIDVIPKASTNGGLGGVACRVATGADTFYMATYLPGTTSWAIYKRVAGTYTQIGTPYSQALTAGTAYTLRLTVTGTLLSLSVDGVVRSTATDSAISSGRCGIVPAGTTSLGFEFDNYAQAAYVAGLIASISSATISASDTGLFSEPNVFEVAIGSSDSGTFTDTSSVTSGGTTTIIGSDAGLATDASFQLLVPIVATQTGTATSTASVAVVSPGTAAQLCVITTDDDARTTITLGELV